MRTDGQDRVVVFGRDEWLVVALADGAGGTSNGAFAAQAVVDAARDLARPGDRSPEDCVALLQALDADPRRLHGGQTTAVLLVLDDVGLVGASAGDSEAWLVDPDQRIKSLTANQLRKPLVGSGAQVTPFRDTALGRAGAEITLLVASDGLFRFAAAADIARIVVGDDLATAAEQLVSLVRTPTGALLDDISLVLVRGHSS